MTQSEIEKAAEYRRTIDGNLWDAVSGLQMDGHVAHGNEHFNAVLEELRSWVDLALLAGAEHAKPRWVKCSERLPKEAMDVLALDAHGFARVVYWQTNDKWTDSEDGVSETQFRQWYTHWTTLPPAPEAESK